MRNYILNKFLSYRYDIKIAENCRVSRDSKFGKNCHIERGSLIANGKVGAYVYIGNESRIFKTDIGNYSSIGPRVTIGENEHILSHYSTSNYLLSEELKQVYENINKVQTQVGNDVWIGAGAFIKKGIKIGDGAVVGAGAIVTKDVAAYDIVAGIPAKIISTRLDNKTRDLLMNRNWWDMAPEEARCFFYDLQQESQIETD